MVDGGTVRTAITPRGPMGELLGRASVAEIRITGGRLRPDFGLVPNGRTRVPVYVDRTIINATDCEIEQGVPARLRTAATRVTLDGSALIVYAKPELVHRSESTVCITVTAQALEAILARELPQLRNLSVILEPGRALIEASSSIMPGRITALAEIADQAQDEAWADIRLWINRKQAPPALETVLMGALDPRAMMNRMTPMISGMQIRQITVREGCMDVLLAERSSSDIKRMVR